MNLLSLWIIFNIFISSYEIYIYINRDKINKKNCHTNFWSFKDIKNFWIDGWTEYTCYTDNRYFDKNNYVYNFELLNVICTILLVYFYLKNNINMLIFVLYLQLITCALYFLSLPKFKLNNKSISYLGISYLWIIFPLFLIRSLYK